MDYRTTHRGTDAQKAPNITVPAWLFELGPSFLKSVRRIAARRGFSEADLLRRALKLVQQEKPAPSNATPKKEKTFYIESLSSQLTVSKAKLLLRELGAYFGGQTKLDAQKKKERASNAAKARWKKQRERETPGKDTGNTSRRPSDK